MAVLKLADKFYCIYLENREEIGEIHTGFNHVDGQIDLKFMLNVGIKLLYI